MGEMTNADRAARAEEMLERYREQYDQVASDEEVIIDLVADMIHWADRQGFRFDAIVETAGEHFAAESAEEAKA